MRDSNATACGCVCAWMWWVCVRVCSKVRGLAVHANGLYKSQYVLVRVLRWCCYWCGGRLTCPQSQYQTSVQGCRCKAAGVVMLLLLLLLLLWQATETPPEGRALS